MLHKIDTIYEIYFAIADRLKEEDTKHPPSLLYRSEIVLIGMIYALKGTSFTRFYDWFSDLEVLNLPERSRLTRLIEKYEKYTERFLSEETLFNITDSIGVEIIKPIRENRSEESKKVSKKGLSNHRWIVGRKINVVINEKCEIVIRQHTTQNECDNTFDDDIEKVNGIVLADGNYPRRNGQTPKNMKICARGKWNERMCVETLFSLWTRVCNMKQSFHRTVRGFEVKAHYLCALTNVLIKLNDKFGFKHLSMVQWAF